MKKIAIFVMVLVLVPLILGVELQNPKEMKIFSNDVWEKGTDEIVTLKVYDHSDNIMIPEKITVSMDKVYGIKLMRKDVVEGNITNIYFRIADDAEIGDYKFLITVEDERTLEEEFEIVVIQPITDKEKELMNKRILWTIVISLAVLVVISILLAFFLIIDISTKMRR